MALKKAKPDLRVRVRLHRDMLAAAQKAARVHGLSLNAEVNFVLRHHYYKITPTAVSYKIERSYGPKPK